jgi:hypothetical protein
MLSTTPPFAVRQGRAIGPRDRCCGRYPDTREVWASYFLPQDRVRMIELLAGLPNRVPDETTRIDLAAFTAALQAMN